MAENKKICKNIDPKVIAYIAGGAVAGGIVGYIIHKVGFKNVAKILKDKNIISSGIGDFIKDFDLKSFTSKNNKDFEDLEED
ncbi:MAG: hypothetical protein M1479_00775 [Actinobacteria bacterium]|nr:hypothetical protein [Cyanobacteriota bacterium]MCL5770796.1 hypothetical protein [Actinomycetota bacterium]